MIEAQIKHMVDRFLMWKLPAAFNPDGGISFERIAGASGPHPFVSEPVGTNLFSADQAAEMVRHMLEGLPSASPAPSTEGLREALAWLADAVETERRTYEDHRRLFDPEGPIPADKVVARTGDAFDAAYARTNEAVKQARTALAGVTAPADTFDLEAFLADELEPGELRPCPFCGGKAEVHEFDDVGEDDENFGGSAIMCTQCQCSTAVYFDRKEHLYSSWNERSKPVAPSAGVTAREEQT